jgi:hypothetical protein
MPTEIPLKTGVPSQTFKVDLEGNTYNFRVMYNSRIGVWTFDLSDEDGNPLASGVTMVLGADLIDQFNLGIGSLIMVSLSPQRADASDSNLGSEILLVHVTQEEKENGITI